MSKKIKKRVNQGTVQEDPNLEPVDDDRIFEVELDEETEEIINVHHYRYKFGDEFEADIEHAMTLDDAKQYVMCLLSFIERIEQLQLERLNKNKENAVIEKVSTVEHKEGNPLRESKIGDE
jgi:hypothetical protein